VEAEQTPSDEDDEGKKKRAVSKSASV